jgi:hypothetical protein
MGFMDGLGYKQLSVHEIHGYSAMVGMINVSVYRIYPAKPGQQWLVKAESPIDAQENVLQWSEKLFSIAEQLRGYLV